MTQDGANGIKVFFCAATGDVMANETFYCATDHRTEIDLGRMTEDAWRAQPYDSDKKISCVQCGEVAQKMSRGSRRIFRRADTGEEVGLKDSLPAGAVFEGGYREGADRRGLICVCPDGHHWFIDGRASNCGSPCKKCGVKYRDHKETACGYEDSIPAHRCWVRSGRPEDGTLHVDKNGLTCDAGAGSIQTGQWHGFLHHGLLHA
jgi:hypothetical protein